MRLGIVKCQIHLLATKKTQTTNKLKKIKAGKRPFDDITNDDNDFQPKKKPKSVSQKPRTDLLFTTCKVLYDDGVWYDGTVCGFEYCETESVEIQDFFF